MNVETKDAQPQTKTEPRPVKEPETNNQPPPGEGPEKDKQEEVGEYIGQGWEHYKKKQFKKAEAAFRRAADADPNSAAAHRGLGVTLYRLSEFKEAEAAFRGAVKADARSAEAYAGLGDALAELFRYEDAREAYDKALGEDCDVAEPDTRAEANYGRGVVFYALRQFAVAAECFDTAATLFDDRERECRAESEHAAGNGYEARSGDMHNDRGYSLFELKRYDEAQQEFKIAIEKGRKYPYAYHSMASLLWAQGKYQEAVEYWDEAYYRYDGDVAFAEADEEFWPGHFMNFGNMLHEVYGDLERAEEMYKWALKLLPRNVTTRMGLASLYVERAASVADRADSYRKARAFYDQARMMLTDRLRNVADLSSLLALADLYLAWNDYDGAERWHGEEAKHAEKLLKDALALDEEGERTEGYSRTAKPQASLGVLYARQKRYQQAIKCFRDALNIEPDDLTLRSNLAEAYLRANQLDNAEREYQSVIKMVPEHIESLVGLGEVYLTRGDGNDPDMYDQAVTMFTTALKLAHQRKGSKRLKNKEQAKVLYLRAYARVKSFEGSKLWKDQRPLFFARDDFKLCFKIDPELYLAQRAIDKIEKNLTAHTPQRLLEKFGPFLVLFSASLVFALAQWSYFYRGNSRLSAEHYIFMTFGSLLLMVASSYLPQILKLKFAGLELEKSVVDQVATLGTLGISKGV